MTIPDDPSFWAFASALVTGAFTVVTVGLRQYHERWMIRHGRTEPAKLPVLPLLVLWGVFGLGLLLGQPVTRVALGLQNKEEVAAKKKPPRRDCNVPNCPTSCACRQDKCDCPTETERRPPTSLASFRGWLPSPIPSPFELQQP